MSEQTGSDALAVLDAWRERGAQDLDPVRFQLIDALARRAARHGGQARRILDDRVSVLLAAYRNDLDKTVDTVNPANPQRPAPGPLAGLLETLGTRTARAEGDRPAGSRDLPHHADYPDMKLLDDFRQTWFRLSTDRQLRQSQAQVPDNAGPLNSSHLVHRSLSLMRELSPGYLHQFLSYLDALSWLEQLDSAGAAAAGRDTSKAAGARKPARGKSR